MSETGDRPVDDVERPTPDAESVRAVDSRALLAGAKELVIRHGGEVYRLRLTAKDKLILTK